MFHAQLFFSISDLYLFIFVLAIICYQQIHLSVELLLYGRFSQHTYTQTNTYRGWYIYSSIHIFQYISTLLLLLLLFIIIIVDVMMVDVRVQYANFQRMDVRKKNKRAKHACVCVRVHSDA